MTSLCACTGRITDTEAAREAPSGAGAKESAGGRAGGEGVGPAAGGSEGGLNAQVAMNARFRRLTRNEMVGAASTLLKLKRSDVEQAFAGLPPDEANSWGFTLPRTVNEAYTEALAVSASALASNADLAKVAPDWTMQCEPAKWGTADCVERFVRLLGKRGFRRPLEQIEVQRLVDLANAVRKEVQAATPADALKAVLVFILQSPEFLYLWERGPAEQEIVANGRVSMNSYEIASRLAFLFWSEPPDDTLLAEAEAGRLLNKDALAKQAARLLDDPRAESFFERFFTQWLKIDGQGSRTRSPADDGATLTPALWAAMQQELREYVRYVMRDKDGSFNALMTLPVAMVNKELARFYRLPEPQGAGFAPTPRPGGGLMSLGAFLVSVASHNAPSPTHFGVAVRDAMLCDQLAPPPPGVSTNLPPINSTATLRERSAAHVKAASCKGCHQSLDPIGFAGLAYDHLGRPATRQEDTTGIVVDYEPGVDKTFLDIAELSHLVGESTRARTCFSRQWLRFASGLNIDGEDALPVSLTAVASGPGDIRSMIVAIVSSDPFRYREPFTQD